MASKRYGLRLALRGAPNTPHAIPGLPGYYRPDVPTPVGGEGDALTLEEAREAAARIDAVELVELSPDEAKAAAKQAKQDVKDGQQGVVEAARSRPQGAEASQVNDEREAVKKAVKEG